MINWQFRKAIYSLNKDSKSLYKSFIAPDGNARGYYAFEVTLEIGFAVHRRSVPWWLRRVGQASPCSY